MSHRQPRRHLDWLAARKRRRRTAPLQAETATLLGALGDGDVDAFPALYDHTCARLYGVALRVLRDPLTAQEATRRAYLKIRSTAASFDPAHGSAEAWLTTLIHGVAVETLRAEPCRSARILGCSNGNHVGGCHYVVDEVRHHVVSAQSVALNDWQREAIALAYYGAMTYEEVAEFLDVPVSAVASRIRAGLERMAQSSGRA